MGPDSGRSRNVRDGVSVSDNERCDHVQIGRLNRILPLDHWAKYSRFRSSEGSRYHRSQCQENNPGNDGEAETRGLIRAFIRPRDVTPSEGCSSHEYVPRNLSG